jgi:REP element-mobilizing transposase RayT
MGKFFLFDDMPRQLRVQYPGAIYHVMDRGDRREDIFVDDVDRQDFLKTLAEACLKTGWQVHAYCLMRNHFHMVLETPNANLVEGMRWFLSSYTIRLNHRQKLFGHVFSGRYKALIVDGSGNGYLRTACDYVHLNPVRAKLLQRDERLLAYPWSSLVWYLAAPEHRPKWIRVDRLLGEHGIQQHTAGGRQQFEQRMEKRRLEETDEESLKIFRRGWCLGSEEFREQMLEKMEGKLGDNHAGLLHQESALARADRIIAEELRRLGWTESELAARPKSDPNKLGIGARLRKETTLTIKSIAAKAHLGTAKSANARLHGWMRNQSDVNLPQSQLSL